MGVLLFILKMLGLLFLAVVLFLISGFLDLKIEEDKATKAKKAEEKRKEIIKHNASMGGNLHQGEAGYVDPSIATDFEEVAPDRVDEYWTEQDYYDSLDGFPSQNGYGGGSFGDDDF